MIVGISLLTLVPGIVGGSETYVRGLLGALSRTGELEYRVFLPTIAPDAAEGLQAEVVTSYRASRTMRGRALAMALGAARPGRVRKQLALHRLDVVHFPLSVMLPPITQPAAVTSIHDVQHEYFPQFFPKAELAYRRAAYGRTARRSAYVITVSEHARQTLVDRLGLEAGRVRVVHHGVDHDRFRPGSEARQPLLLYPAARWPHKNHERLLDAFAMLRRQRRELRLVLTGAGHDGRQLPPGVEAPGRVPLDRLAELYRTAAALVFPSLYEGFGQPAVEAMASGCPAVVSRISPLEEVCGDAVGYFDPTAPEEMAAAIGAVLDDPRPYAEAGIRRAARFTWEHCAQGHEAVYREAAAGAA